MAITMDARGRRRDAGAPALGVPSLAERSRFFRDAQRHTRRVKVLRIALPVAAVAIAAFYALVLTRSWQLGRGHLSVGEVQVTADDLTMKNPKYFGVTKDGGRYEVRAKQAVVAFNQQAPIKLIGIEGDLVQPNNVVTKMTAKHGLLDNAKSQLELYDGIEIDASNGLKARLSRATVYAKEHRIVSKQPVDVLTATGRVQGSAMTLRTDTRQAAFVGNVAVRLVPSGAGGETAALGRDSRQPVDVTAEQLHVDDNIRTAVFMGDVVAVQGESMMKTPELHVSYEGKPASEQMTAAPGQSGEGSRLSRLLGTNGVVVSAGSDRRVSSDQVEFDAKANTALFTGNVLVNQQKNVLQGRRLFIDRKAGRSRLDAPGDPGQPSGRIAATFFQSERATAPRPKPAIAEATAAAAGAQQGVFSSFRADPNAPMDVEADTLNVYDANKTAVFHGNVKAQQGEFVVRTVELTAHYSGQTGLGLSGGAEDPGGKAPAQITSVDARQKVLVTSKDGQTATGEWATFDMKANTVLMGDHVVVSRGKDVAEGPRLKIDLTTGMYRFELETETVAAPAMSASPPQTSPAPPKDPASRSCPPGKQCLLVYPKEAHDKAKEAMKKLLPDASATKPSEGWQPATSASPVQRSD
jgi:LPS export ABC transporter protein LptC/lipopolysaccharide transport protein LptA